MKIGTILMNGREIAALVIDGIAVPLDVACEHSGNDWDLDLLGILEHGQLDGLQSWHDGLDEGDKQALKMAGVQEDQATFCPPYRHPKRIWGIGLNYVDHATDLSEKAPTSEPASFMKAETTIIGPGDDIHVPLQSQRTTGEGELGIILKERCKDVARDDWLDVVAGFTTIIDMTAEDILRKNPRYLTLSKNFDTFFSFGPLLLTPDEIGSVLDLTVATLINGKVHANNTVANMTFPPDFLISFHSKVMTLLPGDIISTGTPRATPLAGGDVVGCKISGFPVLENPVVDLKE
ncbi:fumarylacetoacetate hydrolase [Candidatus Bathyarchaeota archaeon]|nr:fumarylacetoacetate hydrolase [Candidatus Bathyarchaeota archaeon]